MTDDAPLAPRVIAIGDAPSWLTDAGREIWAVVAPDLRATGLLTAADHIPLGRYCDHMARWLALRKDVNARGETYVTESKHGKLERIDPRFKAMLELESKMEPLEDRFGLSPMMRLKMKSLRQNVGETDLMRASPSATDVNAEGDASPFGLLM